VSTQHWWGRIASRLTHRLHYRLLAAIMLLVLLQTVLWAYLAVSIATPIAHDQAVQDLSDRVQSASARVDQTMGTIDGLSLQIVVDISVQRTLEQEAQSAVDSYKNESDNSNIESVVAHALSWTSLPLQIGVLGSRHHRYGENTLAMDWHLDIDPQFGAAAAEYDHASLLRWTAPYVSRQPTDNHTMRWVAAVRPVPDSQTFKNIGLVVIELPADQFGLQLPSATPADHQQLALFTSSGQLISGTTGGVPETQMGGQPGAKSPDEIDWHGRHYLMVRERLQHADWLVVGYIPWTDANLIVTQIERTIAAVAVAEVCLAIVIAWKVSVQISRPLQRLLIGIRQVRTGQWAVHVPVTPPDEVAELSMSFNAMAEQIRFTMASLEETRQRELNARLEMLGGQINSHFLFNALEVMTCVAYTEGPDAVTRVAVALGKLLRYTLDTRQALATVLDEVKQVENYLLIQSERFEDVLSYRVDVDPAVQGCIMPRFSLQPLVENAVKHGVYPAKRPCTIIVRAARRGSDVVVEVENDGVDIPASRAAELEASLKAEGVTALGIGLMNVHRRLQLQFGTRAGLEIDARTGSTVVRIFLPILSQEEVHDVSLAHSG
jgi:two-component system sensor histidine kinase YesM